VTVLNQEKGELTIFAVNRAQEEALDLICDLQGFYKYEIAEHIVLEHEDVKATNTEENPDNVVPHKNGSAVFKDGVVKARLARLSWNVIRLKEIS
jgi:alpha-N-arabinofuranosidase